MNLRQYPIYFYVFISTYYKYIYKYIHLCTSMLLCLLRCLFFLVYRDIITQLLSFVKSFLHLCCLFTTQATLYSLPSRVSAIGFLAVAFIQHNQVLTMSFIQVLFSLIFLFCERSRLQQKLHSQPRPSPRSSQPWHESCKPLLRMHSH